jgi:hypothetical protein
MEGREPGVILLDDRRVFVAANEVAADLLGVPADDLLGRRADEFMPVVAKALYPLAWQGFLIRRRAAGEYAAHRADGSLAPLAYVGFANRPINGLHFFVLEPLEGGISGDALVPRMQKTHVQVGRDLSPELQSRLITAADRAERRLPVASGAQRAVVAALFDQPEKALDVLDALRTIESVDVNVASAAGSTPDAAASVLAGRVPYSHLGVAVEKIRAGGGRILTNLDERRVWPSSA